MAAPFKEWMARLGRSNAEIQSEDRRRQAEASGADTIEQCQDRAKVRLRGTLEVVTLRSRRTTPWLEAELSDGTGVVTLIWMGRHEIPGINAGATVEVEGRISDVDGERRIYNPRYVLR